MTRDEAAAKMDGNEYRKEGSKELFSEMKAAGLVAVFGGSDDQMQFAGAFFDELDVYGGGVAHLTNKGLLTNPCECGDCPYFADIQEKAAAIEAIWDDGGFSWRMDTSIPHAKFVIMEDGDTYCEGLVFALADVPSDEPQPALTDPNVVHANMLRGTVAKPTFDQIKHLYPEDFEALFAIAEQIGIQRGVTMQLDQMGFQPATNRKPEDLQ